MPLCVIGHLYKFSVPMNHLENFLSANFGPEGLEWGLPVYISNKLLGDAHTAGPQPHISNAPDTPTLTLKLLWEMP